MSAIRLPTPLRGYADGQKEVVIDADTVGQALSDLAQRYPGLRPHLFDDQGALRQYVNVFVNDEDLRSLKGDATPLKAEDRLTIVPSIAGGA